MEDSAYDDKDVLSSPQRVKLDNERKVQVGPSGYVSGDPCPICKKLYPNSKKREHFAACHFQPALREYVQSTNGMATCKICGKKGEGIQHIARHCGLKHNKLMEVVGEEHMGYITDFRKS